jgi:hypothetical protein
MAGTTAFDGVQGLTPAIMSIASRVNKLANSDAYKTAFLMTIAFNGIGVILILFTPNIADLMTSDATVMLDF